MAAERMRTLSVAVAGTVLLPSGALAHGGGTHGAVFGAPWTVDPWIVMPLAASAMLFATGNGRLRLKRRRRGAVRDLRCPAFLAGWLVLVLALVSPLHWLGEHLFTAHMIEHELVMAVAAPLLVIARPVGPMLWALPRAARQSVATAMRSRSVRSAWLVLTAPAVATTLHAIAIWGWHAPVAFETAVGSETLHRLQHLSFFLTAFVFWWAVFRRSEAGRGAWHVFVTMLHMSALGALIALAPRVLYGMQTSFALAWGLTPLGDQQLAGLVMWVPAGTLYAAIALVLLARLIRRSAVTAGRQHAPR